MRALCRIAVYNHQSTSPFMNKRPGDSVKPFGTIFLLPLLRRTALLRGYLRFIPAVGANSVSSDDLRAHAIERCMAAPFFNVDDDSRQRRIILVGADAHAHHHLISDQSCSMPFLDRCGIGDFARRRTKVQSSRSSPCWATDVRLLMDPGSPVSTLPLPSTPVTAGSGRYLLYKRLHLGVYKALYLGGRDDTAGGEYGVDLDCGQPA